MSIEAKTHKPQPSGLLRSFAPGTSGASVFFSGLKLLLVSLIGLLGTGCASYPQRTAGALRDFQRGQFEAALKAFGDSDVVDSPFLSAAEAGTVALTAGEWERARVFFNRAAAEVEEVEGRALVDPQSFMETLGSWGLNDTTKTYRGEGYERVTVHAALAMTYLAQGDMDGVWVEVQRANRLLEAEEELYEKDYRAGGLGHFLSAMAYELLGEYDQAYIDYKRMEEKGVGLEIAGPALLRLGRRLQRDDELPRWEELYAAGDGYGSPDPNSASVVVIAGVGMAPFKFENSLVIPTRQGLISMAVPGFQQRQQPVGSLRLRAQELAATVRTAELEHVSAIAAENLEDRLAWTATKSVARGILKRELTKHLEDEHGPAGRLAGDLFSAITERADLRSWQTLPDTWQAGRLFVPPGVHTFTLEALGGEAVGLGTYELEPGETMLVFARTIEQRLYAHTIGGNPVAPVYQGELATELFPAHSNSPMDNGEAEWLEPSLRGETQ